MDRGKVPHCPGTGTKFITPTTVFVHYSEADELEGEKTYSFEDFEFRAGAAAYLHTGGSYLKTKVTVTFDSGDTYACRIDLGDDVSGFQSHIRQGSQNFWSVSGVTDHNEMPKTMAADNLKLQAVRDQMVFPVVETEEPSNVPDIQADKIFQAIAEAYCDVDQDNPALLIE